MRWREKPREIDFRLVINVSYTENKEWQAYWCLLSPESPSSSLQYSRYDVHRGGITCLFVQQNQHTVLFCELFPVADNQGCNGGQKHLQVNWECFNLNRDLKRPFFSKFFQLVFKFISLVFWVLTTKCQRCHGHLKQRKLNIRWVKLQQCQINSELPLIELHMITSVSRWLACTLDALSLDYYSSPSVWRRCVKFRVNFTLAS